MAEHDWPSIIQPVAESFWGEPNKKLSTAKVLVWGSQGSRKVNLADGTWFDHEQHIGGGVADLVRIEAGLGDDKSEAMAWLEREGFIAATEKPQERRERQSVTDTRPEPEQPPASSSGDDGGVLKWVKGYTYHDADGNALYQVLRGQWELPDGSWRLAKDGQIAKTFRQRRKDASGKIVWNLDGIGHTIYRHQQVELAIEAGKTILCPEGEKDADTAVELGFEASTNSGGAKNWTPELAALFKDADVVIPVDNDPTGIEAGEAKAKSLKGIARRIRILNFADHVPNFPAKHDLTNWVEAGGTAEELQRIIDSLPDWKPKPPKSAFGAQTSNSIAAKPVVYDWLVKHLIERNGVLIIAGESQAGKSFLVMDMGMKIARGIDYAGHRVKQGAVIHMAVEDGKGTELRHKGYRKANGISPDADVPYVIMDPFANGGQGFSLMSDEQVDKFIAECLEWKEFYGSLEFIIIDTLAMATEGMDENSSGEASKVLGRVNRIRERTGATVCIVHHMNAGGTRVRGSTAIVANVPNVIELKQMMTIPQNRKDEPRPILDGDKRPIRRARLAKNKNGAANVSWAIVLSEVELDEKDEDGEPYKTMICARPAKRERSDEPAKGINSDNQRILMEALNDAIADRGKDMPSGVRVGPQIKQCVDFTVWRDYVRKRWHFKDAEADEQAQNEELGKAMASAGKALMNAGYMGRDNDKGIVWSLGKDRKATTYHSEPPALPEPPPALPDDVQRELVGAEDEPPF